jgi:hypothetical protein
MTGTAADLDFVKIVGAAEPGAFHFPKIELAIGVSFGTLDGFDDLQVCNSISRKCICG